MKYQITVDGERLRIARKASGLSLRGLAAICGLSAMFISLLERDSCGASPASLNAIATALDIPAEALRK